MPSIWYKLLPHLLLKYYLYLKEAYIRRQLSPGDTSQDPHWLPQTMDSAEHYIHRVLSYTSTPFHLKKAL